MFEKEKHRIHFTKLQLFAANYQRTTTFKINFMVQQLLVPSVSQTFIGPTCQPHK